MKDSDTAKRILSEASRLFNAKGYTDTSIGEICKVSGVTKPSIYYYYESKAGLYKAAYMKACQDVASSDIWSCEGNPDTVIHDTLYKLIKLFYNDCDLATSLNLMLMEYIHPRLKNGENIPHDLTRIRTRMSDICNRFYPSMLESDKENLTYAILGQLIMTRFRYFRNARIIGEEDVQNIAELIFRFIQSMRSSEQRRPI